MVKIAQKQEVNSDFMDMGAAFKKEVVAEVFSLQICSKTITLLAGQSLAGKTVMSLHFADDCVKKNQTVCYFDTDSHPVSTRPDPNLLKGFINKDQKGYGKYFKYTTKFNEDFILKSIDKHRPALVVIDSIYTPYSIEYPNAPKLRAQMIRKFLLKLRDKIYKHGCSVLLISQVGKENVGANQDPTYSILGGEGLKHLSDCKWVLDFAKDKKKMGQRILLIDRQAEVLMTIGYGGIIEKVSP